MGYKICHSCPFLSVGGFKCHHRYGPRDKNNKTICRHLFAPFQCPLYKLWEAQLDSSFKTKKNLIFPTPQKKERFLNSK